MVFWLNGRSSKYFDSVKSSCSKDGTISNDFTDTVEPTYRMSRFGLKRFDFFFYLLPPFLSRFIDRHFFQVEKVRDGSLNKPQCQSLLHLQIFKFRLRFEERGNNANEVWMDMQVYMYI